MNPQLGVPCIIAVVTFVFTICMDPVAVTAIAFQMNAARTSNTANNNIDNNDNGYTIRNYQQHFLFQLEDQKTGSCLNAYEYLTLETNNDTGSIGHGYLYESSLVASSTSKSRSTSSSFDLRDDINYAIDHPPQQLFQHGTEMMKGTRTGTGTGTITNDRHWVQVLYADPVTNRLEFTVRASKKIKKGWKLMIYPIPAIITDNYNTNNGYGGGGNRLYIGQQSSGASANGDIFALVRRAVSTAAAAVVVDVDVDDDDEEEDIRIGTYWEKRQDIRIRKGHVVCTIIANEK